MREEGAKKSKGCGGFGKFTGMTGKGEGNLFSQEGEGGGRMGGKSYRGEKNGNKKLYPLGPEQIFCGV